MSREQAAEALNTPIEIIGGRQPAPYSKTPIWLIFAVSPMARALYDVLAAHLNYERGDSHVWPTRETLAELMGVKQARSVDKYLKELETAGAIDVIHRKTSKGMRDRNVYVIHHDPPDGYTGPRSMPEYYRAQKGVSAGQPVVRSSAQRAEQEKHAEPSSKDSGIPTQNGVSAGQPVVHSSALRSAFQRTRTRRKNLPPTPGTPRSTPATRWTQ